MLYPISQSSSQTPLSNHSPSLQLGSLFTEVNRLVRQARKTGTVPRADLELLLILDSVGPQTVPQIARRLTTSRQSIQLIVNRLQRKALVKTMENPAHRRSLLIRLSSSGRKVATASATQTRQFLATLADQLNPDQIAKAAATVSQIGHLLAGNLKNSDHHPKSHHSHPPDETQDQDSLPVNLL